MSTEKDSTRKNIAILLLVCLLAPAAAVIVYVLFNNLPAAIILFVFVGLCYFPMKWIAKATENYLNKQ
jgi:hypothetical protein